MRRVLLAVDGSESADAALEFAIDLCRGTGASLDVISVTPAYPAPRIGWGSPEEREVDEPGGAEQIAMAAAARADIAGVQSRAHVERGDPAEVINGAAAGLEADLIVAGSRGRGPITSALVGSVSAGLLEHARVPVTIVRALGRQPA